MDAAPDDLRLGDYQLQELLTETSVVRTWLAEQVSVRRPVLVDQLLVDDVTTRSAFLADVRAKASVDHPLIGSVFQAVADASGCYFARERLRGATLAEHARHGDRVKPVVLTHALRRIAEANLYLENRRLATLSLGLEEIHLDEHGVTRLVNLAIAGERAVDQSLRDIAALGAALPAFLSPDATGATRLLTLFGWMRGEGLARPLDWTQVRDYATQIEVQLAKPAGRTRRKNKAPGAIVVVAGLLLAGGATAFFLRSPKPAKAELASKPAPPEMLAVKAGEYPTPDGLKEKLPAFEIGAHEVTIGQYAAFLDALAVLAREGRGKTFDDPAQPAGKAGHEPDDWVNLLTAAKANSVWQNRLVALESPVVGVDWWDAAAYCEWAQGRLPTQEEWFAALNASTGQPAALKPSNWLPVTAGSPDRTPNGLQGMAGSVAEWTNSLSANPANPMGEKLWVVIGGSYLKPANGALAREWVEDRGMRRPDVGFRVVK
ncbi:MAG TPA: SUMF1/EgtB/PvdO family nonheme iron enzyme [Luteolibacter sp.]